MCCNVFAAMWGKKGDAQIKIPFCVKVLHSYMCSQGKMNKEEKYLTAEGRRIGKIFKYSTKIISLLQMYLYSTAGSRKASLNQSKLMNTKACVYLYPEIQFCADSGRLCLFQAPRPALCAGRCGPDDQHTVVGRRERCVRREDAWRVPPRALRRTMLDRQQGGKIREEKEDSAREGKEKILKRRAQESKQRVRSDWGGGKKMQEIGILDRFETYWKCSRPDLGIVQRCHKNGV